MATETFLAVPAVRKNGTRVSIEFTIFPYRNREGNLIGNRGHRALRHEALRRNAGAAPRRWPHNRPITCVLKWFLGVFLLVKEASHEFGVRL